MLGNSILILCAHGTYGHDDDAYGAMLLANTSLAKGLKTTLLLIDDGVFMAKKDQNPSKIGLPSNLNEILDFLALDGQLLVVKDALKERGIDEKELVQGAGIIDSSKIPAIIIEHSVSITF
ncbi:MAG: DsrE family protein [Candidatus Thermoplasmatota archaeon]|nr:DsrE family protein [Euryarchaeota archaeon]MBU4032283.1 DsrE family protein [Candidatus Thermoplasmatota archaeon]MBU4070896.1 DsrE family protein [Candidatus Thermoplasmatota archaeon]MBU4144782.1 DsrE family protein [Candidatus Thermoplasmatota archaeon]MBU4591460.1 DsrE family protein [Candidatus Thermoplasmatota archaeon]